MNDLELSLVKLNDKLDNLDRASGQFSEMKEVPKFEEGRSFKELGLLAVGAAVSGIAGGFINKFIPVGGIAPILAGGVIRFIVHNPTVQTIADGMIVSGIAVIANNLLGGKGFFGEAYAFPSQQAKQQRDTFSETRVGGVNFG